MEIYMYKIEFIANQFEVTEELAKVFHSSEFFSKPSHSSSPPAGKRKLNFNIQLNPSATGGVRNDGTGSLTLPERAIGDRFLRLIASKQIQVLIHGRAIRFSPSRTKPSRKLVDTLRKVPYQDPAINQEREGKLSHLKEHLRVDKLQFGVWSHRPLKGVRGIFCSEWEKSYTSIGNALISIEYDHKSIRLQLGSSAMDEIAYSVVIKFSNIQDFWIGYEIGNPFACFDLLTPPILECEWFNRSTTGVVEDDSRKFRQRIGSIDPAHAIIAPYAHQVRITLYRDQDLDKFASLCFIAGFRKPKLVDVDSENRGLFSPKKLIQVQKWLESLDWSIGFQIEALLHNGLLNSDQLMNGLRTPIRDLCADHPTLVSEVLRHFNQALQSRPASQSVLRCFQQVCTRKLSNPEAIASSAGTFNCHHVTFTPTRMTLEGPYVTQSNRVIRQYPMYQDHFLRVDFRDEDRLQYRWDREVDGTTFLQERVGGILKEGFLLAGRHFQFLAYSSSALREHAVWFMNPFVHPQKGLVTPQTIRQSLGDFSGVLLCPSKYAARLAQAFTATDPSVTITRAQWEEIPDMGESPYEFTDGIGTISRELSDKIWDKLCEDSPDSRQRVVQPSAYQIRFLSYKGMVSVDEQLPGIKMCLRPSMNKFSAHETQEANIEIARAFERPGSMYLNRSLIMILEDRGVDAEVFMSLQEKAVAEARTAHDSVDQLCHLLKSHSLCTAFGILGSMRRLNALGLDLKHRDRTKCLNSPFISRVIHYSINTVLRDVKYRCRIPVPKSWKLVGVADEGPAYEAKGCDNVFALQEGEIYACIKDDNSSEPVYLKGYVVISRSPTVHPGDVQRVWAIGKPPADKLCLFRNLVNVVVFSCHGERSLASCLGGGDLDGDLFDVCKDPALLPSVHVKPASYDPVDKREIDIEELLDHDGNIQEERVIPHVCDFVVEYINSDVLGLLSDNHLIRADQSSDGVFDAGCIKLAELCSKAVDYPKNGVPVDIRGSPHRLIPYKPDWKAGGEQREQRTDFYESTRAIGQLFRAIDIDDRPDMMAVLSTPPGLLADPISEALKPLVIPNRRKGSTQKCPNYADRIKVLFQRYTDELRYICATHTVSSSADARLQEEEVVVGTILAQCSQSRWRTERMYRMKLHSSTLVREVKRDFLPKAEKHSETDLRNALDMAWQTWQFSAEGIASSQEKVVFGLNSFGMIALNVIFETLEALNVL